MIEETIVCGEPFEVEFTIEADPGEPMNIIGYSAKIELRSERESGAAIQSFIDGSAELSRINTQGLVRLILPPSFTSTLKFKVGYLDLWLYTAADIDGIRSDPVMLTLHRGVTRP